MSNFNWEVVQERLSADLPEDEYQQWIAPMNGVLPSPAFLILFTYDTDHSEKVQSEYADQMLTVIDELYGLAPTISYSIDPALAPKKIAPKAEKKSAESREKSTSPKKERTESEELPLLLEEGDLFAQLREEKEGEERKSETLDQSDKARWDRCLSYIRERIDRSEFNSWIKPLEVVFKEDHVMVLAANEVVLRGAQRFHQALITEAIQHEAQSEVEIGYGLGTSSDYEGHHVKERSKPRKSRKSGRSREVTKHSVRERPIVTSNLNEEFLFSNFVQGESNSFAIDACIKVANNPGVQHNPLFIHGKTGLGKTHLMHAIGNTIRENYPDARIIYQHCDAFIEDIMRAMRNNTLNELRHFYKSLNAFLIDDIQFLSGRPGSEEVFFHTFNTLFDGGHQVILTCDRYPKELDKMEERLKSRFAAGVVVQVEPPDFNHRVAILEQKAEAWQIDLPHATKHYIAEVVRASIRELEGALKQVEALAIFEESALTLDVAKRALRTLTDLQERKLTIQNIQQVVASFYKIRIDELLGKSRKAVFVRPRHLAMYLSRELTRQSLPEIGTGFGRDHTTIMHACNQMEDRLVTDDQLRKDYLALRSILMV